MSEGAKKEIVAIFGFEVDMKAVEHAEHKLQGFLGKLKEVAGLVAEAFAVEQLFEFAEGQAKAMNAIEHTAAALGMSTDRVQELQYASKALGEDSDFVFQAMKKLEVTAANAGDGSTKLAEAYGKLGVSVKDAGGKLKSGDQLFTEVAAKLGAMENQTEASGIAVKLFGKRGQEMAKFFKDGAPQIGALAKEFHELGGGYDEDAMRDAKEFEHQHAKMEQTFTALKNTISKTLLPAFTKLMDWVQKGIHWFNELSKNSNLVGGALVALGVVATSFAISVLAATWPLILLAAVIAAVVLIADELITLFEGGDTVIGRFLDSIFGKGYSADAVKEIKQWWSETIPVIKEVWEAMKPVLEIFKELLKISALPLRAAMKLSAVVGDTAARVVGAYKTESQEMNDQEKFTNPANDETIRRQGAKQAIMAQMAGGAGPNYTIAPGSNIEDEKAKREQIMQEMRANPIANGLGPLAPPTQETANQGGDTHVQITVNPSPGMDEKAIGAAAADRAHQIQKQRNRETAARFQRAGAQ